MSVYWLVKAADGATLLRHSPVKDNAQESYVDIAVIGRTVKAKSKTSLVAGLTEGTRVDAQGFETETTFKNNSEVRYTVTSIKEVRSSAASSA